MPYAFRQVAELDAVSERAKDKVLARIARMQNPHRPLIAYVTNTDLSVIAVYHGSLDDSWWKRGMAPGERDAQKVEAVIQSATGLQRVSRIHVRQWVVFRIRRSAFQQAAVAVRLSFDQDEDYVELGNKTIATWAGSASTNL